MAEDKKYFTWFDIERILSKVSRDPVESEAELLSWLRAHHVFAVNFRYVHSDSSRYFDIRPFSAIGNTIFRTLREIMAEYGSVLRPYPQESIDDLLRIVEESLSPIP